MDVLKVLCSAVRNNLVDANNVPIRKYKQKILELFGRLTSLVVNDWQVYWNYAEIFCYLSIAEKSTSNGENCNMNQVEFDVQSAEKYFTLLLKAFRNLYNQSNWELSVERCKEVINYSIEILKSLKKLSGIFNLLILKINHIFYYKDATNMESI